MADALASALAFQRAAIAACADEVIDGPWGPVVRTPSLDGVWALNAVLVERGTPALTADELAAPLSELVPTGRWPSILVEDEAVAAAVEPAFAERGWRIQHELFMGLRRAPDREADTSSVREATEDEVAALMDQWFADDFADQGAEVLAQLTEMARRERHAHPGRAFVAGDGRALCHVYLGDGVAQVEDVYTAPDARGQGHARALVTRAITEARAADPRLVCIVADADDTPQKLYARLGFDPIGRVTRFVRYEGAR